jgi:hypothetical protein
MSQNLNLLRQNYCRPATFTGKRTRYLFPLERERVRAGQNPACESTKNAPSPSRVRSIWSSTNLSRRSYRCGSYQSSLSSTSKATTNSLSKSRRIRSPQPPSLTFPQRMIATYSFIQIDVVTPQLLLRVSTPHHTGADFTK